MAFTREEVAKIYVAYFDRAPDKAGLDYWVNDSGFTSLDQVAMSFADQPETKEKYPDSMDNETFINTIYNNMFGRDADADGLAYWVKELEDGNIDRPHMIEAIAMGAKDDENGNDKTVLDNKTEVGLYVADELGINSTDFSLANVTDDPATVEAAKAEAQNYVPVNLNLTTGVDTLEGNKGNDTFTADLLTLNDGDTITDPSTTDSDKLTAEINDDVSNDVTVTNVENIQVTSYGDHDIDMKNMTGVKSFMDADSTGKVTLKNINSADMAIGVKGANTNTVDANYASGVLSGESDKLTVNLDGATGADITTDSGFECVTLNVTGDSTLANLDTGSADKLTIAGDAILTVAAGVIDKFSTVTVEDTAKVTLGNVSGISTLDASANEGGIVAKNTNATTGFATDVITTSTSGATIITGSGDDNINVNSQSNSLHSTTIKTGAGSDMLDLSAVSGGGVYIFAGEGDDALNLGNTYSLSSSDVVDMGSGDDSVNVAAGASHSLIAKGLETLNVTGAAGATSVAFTSVDSAVDIVDSVTGPRQDISVTGLKNGSTFTADKAKVGSMTLGFANGEAATITADLQKGIAGDAKFVNVANATIKSGSDAFTLAGNSILLDKNSTDLTIDVDGNFGTLTSDIDSTASTPTDESLSNLSITAKGKIKLNNIIDDNSLSVIKVESTGTAGSIDIAGLPQSGKDIDTIELKSVGSIGTAINTNIIAESVKTISVESSEGSANINKVAVADATNKDGGIESLTITGKTGAVLGITGVTTVDKLDSLVLTSSNGSATTKSIKGATAESTLGKLEVNAYTDAKLGSITAAALESVTATSQTTNAYIAAKAGALGNINISNKDNSSVISSLKASAKANVSIGNITVDNIDSVTAQSSDAGTVTVGTIDTNTATGKVGDVTATSAKGTVTVNNIGSTQAPAEVGNVDAEGKTGATMGSIISDSIGNITVISSGGKAVLGDTTVAVGKSAINSVKTTGTVGDIEISGKTGATLGKIGNTQAPSEIGKITVTAETNDAKLGGINVADEGGLEVIVDAAGKVTNPTGGVSTITNTKGSIDFTIKSASGAAVNLVDLKAGSAATTSDIDIVLTTTTSKNGTTSNITNNSTNSDSSVVVDLGDGTNTINVKAAAGDVKIAGNDGVDTISVAGTTAGTYDSAKIDGGKGADVLSGGAADDKIYGGDDNDTIVGNKGADSLYGEGGNDVITGGAGKDTITLGNGTDTVSFLGVTKAGDADQVTDFVVGTDKLGLEAANTTANTGVGVAAAVADQATPASNANGASYDITGGGAISTSGSDLITLDTAAFANLDNADLSASTDGTELLKGLVTNGAGNSASDLTLTAANDKFYIATDDGTDGYLYYVNDANGDGKAVASEITLIGEFDSATLDDVVAAQTIMV